MKIKNQRIIFGYLLLEMILLNLAFWMLYWIKYGTAIHQGYLPLVLIYNAAWIVAFFANEANEIFVQGSFLKQLKMLIARVLLFLGIASPLVLLVETDNFSRTMIFGTILVFMGLNLLAFLLVSFLAKRNKPASADRNGTRLLVLGANKEGKDVLHFTRQNKHLGFDVVGFLDDEIVGSNGVKVLGRIDDLPKVLDSQRVDEIVITLPMFREKEIRYAISTADYRGVRVNLVPNLANAIDFNLHAYSINGALPVLEMRQIPLDKFNNYFLKKVFDAVFASAILILLAPLFLFLAILIKLDSKGPVFYKPVRKGQGGKEFHCLKFRTMVVDQPKDLKGKSTLKNDPRITRIGRFLRKTNIDELPQFLNVLMGDMSVVGPRPHRSSLNNEMQKDVERYMVRHYVKPGITGWAQVNGWRGPTETEEQKRERVAHDLWYIRNWSFMLDLRIIFLTVFGTKVWKNAY